MLEEYLVQTCYKITEVTNEFGDKMNDAQTERRCRFREIITTRRESHADIRDADAMLWLEDGYDDNIGDVFLFENVYYEVDRITRARRLGESEVQFIKCELKIINMEVS